MSGLQKGAPWPMPGACPTHIGRTDIPGPKSASLTSYYTVGINTPPIVGADNTVFAALDSGFGAVSPAGDVVYSYPSLCTSEATIAFDGTVYFLDVAAGFDHGVIRGVRSDGSLKWSTEMLEPGVSPVTIGAGGVVYSVVGNALRAWTADGDPLWSAPLPGKGIQHASPAIAPDGTIVVTCQSFPITTFVAAFTPDGSPIFPPVDLLQPGMTSPVIAADGTTYASSSAGLFAIRKDGSTRWMIPGQFGGQMAMLLGADGTLYVTPEEAPLTAIRPTGEIAWTGDMSTFGTTGALITGDGRIWINGDSPGFPYLADGSRDMTVAGWGTAITSLGGLLSGSDGISVIGP
jgi:outer membrane protein assembly factor BamB